LRGQRPRIITDRTPFLSFPSILPQKRYLYPIVAEKKLAIGARPFPRKAWKDIFWFFLDPTEGHLSSCPSRRVSRSFESHWIPAFGNDEPVPCESLQPLGLTAARMSSLIVDYFFIRHYTLQQQLHFFIRLFGVRR
jgi:hypothetical protein